MNIFEKAKLFYQLMFTNINSFNVTVGGVKLLISVSETNKHNRFTVGQVMTILEEASLSFHEMNPVVFTIGNTHITIQEIL